MALIKMPKCIAIDWDDGTPCKNDAKKLAGSDGVLKYCNPHYKNLVFWSQTSPGHSEVLVKNSSGEKEEVCLDNTGYEEKAVWCKDVGGGYARSPRSPYARSPISLMGSPGSPRRGLIRSYNSPVARPGSPSIGTIQQYIQKQRSPIPGSPRTMLQTMHPGGAGLVASVQPGDPANVLLQPGDTGKKPKCDETMTGHECDTDDEEKFVEGREPRGSRLIRAAPDIKLECNPPFINFMNNEGIVNAMEILDRTKDAKEGLEQIAIIKNTIKADPKNTGYNYNVTEGVVDKVAAKFARYMFDADRIELLLTFMFYYDSRDLSQALSFYGFKTGKAKRQTGQDIILPNQSLITILNAADSECYYPTRPEKIPDIRRNMYAEVGKAVRSPVVKDGDGSTDGIDYCAKFNDELKPLYEALTGAKPKTKYEEFEAHCGTGRKIPEKEVKNKFNKLKEEIESAGRPRQQQQGSGGGGDLGGTPAASGAGSGTTSQLGKGKGNNLITVRDYKAALVNKTGQKQTNLLSLLNNKSNFPDDNLDIAFGGTVEQLPKWFSDETSKLKAGMKVPTESERIDAIKNKSNRKALTDRYEK